MISTALVWFGVVLMSYAIYVGHKLIALVSNQHNRHLWYLIYVLIIVFLLGYCIYAFLLQTSLPATSFENQLISTILFFGAVFVVIILQLNYRLIETINKNLSDIQKSNDALTETNKQLTEKESEIQLSKQSLEEAKKTLERKNAELQETLENFYTMRLGLQRDMESGKLDQENARIKERLEELKRTERDKK